MTSPTGPLEPDAGLNKLDEDGGQRLEELGYRQQLRRALSIRGSLALTLSDISPVTSLLIVGSVVVATAGTGSIWAYVIGGGIALCVAGCMGELGSMFPVAGGVFSVVTRVLGKPAGFTALLMYLGQATIVPAAVAVGVGTYIASLDSHIDLNLAAAIFAACATLIALLNVDFSAKLIGFFLVLETVVIVVLGIAGVGYLNQPLDILGSGGISADGQLGTVPTAAIIAAIVVALQSANGFDSALNWSEETAGHASTVGRSVVTSASIGVVFQIVPFVLVLFGAHSLAAFVGSSTPLTLVVEENLGHTWFVILTIGAIIAIFNSVIVLILQFSRILFASGRDNLWPGPLSLAFGQVDSKREAPWVATLLIGVVATVLAYQSSLVSTITLGAIFVTGVYVLVGVAALVSRFTQRELPRPSRMLVWPIPPIIAVAGGVLALTKQSAHDLIIVGGIVAVGMVYYGVYLRGRGDELHLEDMGLQPASGAGGSSPATTPSAIGKD